MGEREAPDGEEEEVPSTSTLRNTSTPVNDVRIPSWIDQPLVRSLTVLFKDRALAQLQELGPEV